MLLLTYPWGNTIGCINLEKIESIIFEDIDNLNEIHIRINAKNMYTITSGSIFTSYNEARDECIVTVKEIMNFERENDITSGMYETTLAQLIMLYVASETKLDFFSFIKKEYLAFKTEQTKQAIDALPD